MERRRSAAAPKRKGVSLVSFLTVLVMLTVTVVTPLIYNRPEKLLARALEKSRTEFFREDVSDFLLQVLRDGSFEAKGEKSTLSYTATLPSSAEMTEQGIYGTRRVCLQGDDLCLQSSALGETAFSAPRREASVSLCNSAFSDAGMPMMQMRLLRTALALSDSECSRAWETLAENAKQAVRSGRPVLQTETKQVKTDGKDRKAKVFTYEIKGEGLEQAFSEWKRVGVREDARSAFTTLRRILSAALSPTETVEGAERFAAFLSGNASEFAALEKQILSNNGRACLSLTVCGGRVIDASALLKGGDFVAEAIISLDAKIRKNDTWSASVRAKSGERELFSLAVDSAVTEDSDSALIRKWNYSFSDSIGAICPETGAESGAITFSWGKVKGDLGLKLKLGAEELVFRGELLKYKKGSKLDLVVGRVEYNRQKLFEDDSYTVTFSKKGKTPTPCSAKEDLFPEGEKRQELAELLTGCFQRF